MVKVVVMRCDKCESDDQVEAYRLAKGGAAPYEVDLCAACAKPLRDLSEIGQRRIARFGESGHASGTRRPPEIRARIYSPEELDALEQAYEEEQKGG